MSLTSAIRLPFVATIRCNLVICLPLPVLAGARDERNPRHQADTGLGQLNGVARQRPSVARERPMQRAVVIGVPKEYSLKLAWDGPALMAFMRFVRRLRDNRGS